MILMFSFMVLNFILVGVEITTETAFTQEIYKLDDYVRQTIIHEQYTVRKSSIIIIITIVIVTILFELCSGHCQYFE